jgi:DNA-binding NarL/FixJ family response regulator
MTTDRDLMIRTGPAVVLALPATARTRALTALLADRGWHVLRAATAAEARPLACRHRADAVVLSADGPGESGWLTCAKLRHARPRLRVLLVGDRTPAAVRFARFVGAAALVPADAGAARLAAAVARSAGRVAV